MERQTDGIHQMRILSDEQMARLDAASEGKPIYPYWHQRGFVERNPLAIARP